MDLLQLSLILPCDAPIPTPLLVITFSEDEFRFRTVIVTIRISLFRFQFIFCSFIPFFSCNSLHPKYFCLWTWFLVVGKTLQLTAYCPSVMAFHILFSNLETIPLNSPFPSPTPIEEPAPPPPPFQNKNASWEKWTASCPSVIPWRKRSISRGSTRRNCWRRLCMRLWVCD